MSKQIYGVSTLKINIDYTHKYYYEILQMKLILTLEETTSEN